MRIGDFQIGSRPLVIAEIGNNHEGRFEVASELVDKAAESGVDAVKFQTFRTELYVDRRDAARFERLKSFELRPEQFAELSRQARDLGLLFISTPFDLPSAQVLEPLVDAYKIASGDNDFYPLIDKVAGTGKPMIISTGASDTALIDKAVSRARSARPEGAGDNLALLHCVSSYPVPIDQANLSAIPTLAGRYQLPTGYSDHSTGNEAAVLAVALGAQILEKHFTLDHGFSDFRDHQLSADPDEMRALVDRVLAAHQLLGNGVKSVQPCEEAVAPAIRRSIIAIRDLPAGHALTMDDLAWVRPSGGLPPGSESMVVGRRLRTALVAGQRLDLGDVE